MSYREEERDLLAELKAEAAKLRAMGVEIDGRLKRKIEEKEAAIGRFESQYGSSCESTGSYCGRGWM
ncbi:hypothetical protein HYT05_02470 [Candidatus Kaiserbacteria bacterium]|nr:hypothetical protein [Candidatus Kaiserbacteria bacterium]